MTRKHLISSILLLCGFCSIIHGQKQIQNEYRINWVTENTNLVTPQYQKYFLDEQIETNEMPYFLISKKIQGSPLEAVATLKNIQTETFNGQGDLNSSLVDKFEIQSSVSYSGNQAYIDVKVLPMRSSLIGIEKLISFDLSIVTRGQRPPKTRTKAASTSVLADGEWYKISIEDDGIYRLDKNFFDSNGISTADLNPNQVNIYGNTGDQLPFDNSLFRHDDLVLNPCTFVGDEDDSFENGEYFIFYGDGSDSWEFEEGDDILNFKQNKHNYSDIAYYYIRVDDITPSRIAAGDQPTGTASYVSESFDEFALHEVESVNLVKSGREWLGENFDLTTQLLLNFSFPNVLPETAYMDVYGAGRSLGGTSYFYLELNSGEQDTLKFNAINTSPISDVVKEDDTRVPFTPISDNIELSIDFNKFSEDSEAWLDYVALQCRRQLTFTGNFMDFRDKEAIGAGIVEYVVGGVVNTNTLRIWDVSDPTQPKLIEFDDSQGDVRFKSQSDALETFVAFTNGSFQEPTFVSSVENQNLHGLENIDYIIVSSPSLLVPANQLADLHRERGLTVEVVTPKQVYNEFSSGNPDVTAIKMLMKSLYDDAAGDESLAPKFLCLFGDGTYRNRGMTDASAYVITYHSKDSKSPTKSYVSDDYFGLLDDNESELTSDKMDIGIGRIIARSEEEGLQMVDKIRRYTSDNSTSDGGAACVGDGTDSTFGSWRNKVVFISDDQDGNSDLDGIIHMSFSDELADTIQTNHNQFNISKLYSDAYEQTSTPGGERYNGVKEEIRRSVQDGALIVNYIGHGGEKGWAHERILDIPTIRGWTNRNRLPVFITATCELTRFDDPEFLSAGELTFLNPDGGAIAMMTTTRIVFSGSNQALAEQFYTAVFGETVDPNISLGEAYRNTKNSVSGENQKNFSLIGDPALVMAHPKKEVYTSTINGVDIQQFTDTLKALQTITVTGYVGNEDGSILESFNGFVYPTVFDKETQAFSLANDASGDNSHTPYDFKVRKNVLYNGKATVTNGEFTFTFVVPKDINYQVGNGKISYYAVGGSVDGHGYTDQFKIGGSEAGVELNDVGPEISLFLNDEAFVDGGITDETPILLARLQDENGINTVGNGIGHDLKVTIDANTSQAIVLNDYYESDEDSYQSGQIRYQFSELTSGTHTLTLKAWDTHNNSSEAELEFVVTESAELALSHVLNYPNPFTTKTEFMFEHNAACNVIDVQVQVFTVSGNLVKTINERIPSSGYRVDGITWNGLDDYGDELARGVYVYKVEVTTPEGRKAEEFQKLVMLK